VGRLALRRDRDALTRFDCRRRLSEGQKLRVGALAEDFTLADSAGAQHTLSAMLSDGPLLIIFYRGYW